MLDPWSALNVANSVVQFLDFGRKLVQGSVELYKSADGTLDRNALLDDLTTDLKEISIGLGGYPQSPGATGNDVPLQRLARSCYEYSTQLLNILEDLRRKENRLKSWESFRQSLRSLVKAGKLGDLNEKLDKTRTELMINLLAQLRFVRAGLITLECFAITFGRNDHLPVLSAIKSMEQENKRTRADTTSNLTSLRSELEAFVVELQQAEECTRRSLQILSTKVAALVEEGQKVEREQKVLRSLYFQIMKLREAEISEAHNKTFRWIFTNTRTTFQSWLSEKSGIFWVSGNAGSGKSTLMKFLCNHPLTEELLRSWAGGKKLVIASHFFWVSGDRLQRSLEGILRTLLHRILKQCPDLIPLVCSSRWEYDDFAISEPWSLSELQVSFDKLSNHDSVSTKFCFFIDGLDEYDGNHYDFIQTFKKLTDSSNFKVCFSSRPWTVFVTNLGQSDKFALHELTKSDIEAYVRDTLGKDARFLNLWSNDSFRRLSHPNSGAEQIIFDIVNRARGVFLWVQLVVDKLRRALGDNVDVKELRETLDALPEQLEDYFKEMLRRIDRQDRERAARVFGLMVEAIQPQFILVFSYLDMEEDNPDYALQLPERTLFPEEFRKQHDRTKQRLNKWCRDFIDLVDDVESQHAIFRYRVDFLHRTVRDFLNTKEMHGFLQEHTPKDFDARLSLCKAILALVKNFPIPNEKSYRLYLDHIFGLADEFLFYAEQIERISKRSERCLLDAFDQVYQKHAKTAKVGHHWSNERDPAAELLDEWGEKTFLACAIQGRLHLYVTESLGTNPKLIKTKDGRPLLDYALRPAIVTPIELPYNREPVDPEMVQILLDRGANPNQKIRIYDNKTTWELFLRWFYERAAADSNMSREALFTVFESLIEHGADPYLEIQTVKAGKALKTIRYGRTVAPEELVLMKVPDMLRTIFPYDQVKQLEELMERKKLSRQSWMGTVTSYLGRFGLT